MTFAPSVLTTSGLAALVEASPDSASLRVNGMLTLVLFQPLVFGAGEGVPKVSTGGVASRLMVTELLVVPAPEATVQLNVVPAVSAVTVVFYATGLRQDVLRLLHESARSPARRRCTSRCCRACR